MVELGGGVWRVEDEVVGGRDEGYVGVDAGREGAHVLFAADELVEGGPRGWACCCCCCCWAGGGGGGWVEETAEFGVPCLGLVRDGGLR